MFRKCWCSKETVGFYIFGETDEALITLWWFQCNYRAIMFLHVAVNSCCHEKREEQATKTMMEKTLPGVVLRLVDPGWMDRQNGKWSVGIYTAFFCRKNWHMSSSIFTYWGCRKSQHRINSNHSGTIAVVMVCSIDISSYLQSTVDGEMSKSIIFISIVILVWFSVYLQKIEWLCIVVRQGYLRVCHAPLLSHLDVGLVTL